MWSNQQGFSIILFFFAIRILEVNFWGKIDDILEEMKQRNMKKVMIVTGSSSYKQCWPIVEKALQKHGIEHLIFDKIKPNPIADTVKEAIKQAIAFGAEFFISIGSNLSFFPSKSLKNSKKNRWRFNN